MGECSFAYAWRTGFGRNHLDDGRQTVLNSVAELRADSQNRESRRRKETLSRAVEYAQRGWHVLPLYEVAAGRCSCGLETCSSPAKHPRTNHGVKDATTDERQIREWWDRRPDANIGIRTGSISGFIVVDLDDDAAIERLQVYGALPETLSVRTGKGQHLYFQRPDIPIRPRTRIVPGVDIRAEDSYVVAPPSIHATGAPYEFADSQLPIAMMPDWLLALAATPTSSASVGERVITEGQRNTRLFSIGGSLVRHGITGARLAEILETTNSQACSPPLPRAEVEGVARSVERYAGRRTRASKGIREGLSSAGRSGQCLTAPLFVA